MNETLSKEFNASGGWRPGGREIEARVASGDLNKQHCQWNVVSCGTLGLLRVAFGHQMHN